MGPDDTGEGGTVEIFICFVLGKTNLYFNHSDLPSKMEHLGNDNVLSQGTYLPISTHAPFDTCIFI